MQNVIVIYKTSAELAIKEAEDLGYYVTQAAKHNDTYDYGSYGADSWLEQNDAVKFYFSQL